MVTTIEEPYPNRLALNGIVKGQTTFDLRNGDRAVADLPYCCFCWEQFSDLVEAEKHCDTSETHKRTKDDYYKNNNKKESKHEAPNDDGDSAGVGKISSDCGKSKMRRSRRLRKAAEMNAPPKPTKKPMTVLNAASKENTDGNAEITSGKKILLTINPDLNKDVPMDVDSTVDFEQLLETISEDGDEDFFDVKTESLEELDVNLKELAHGQGYICTLCHVNIEEGAYLRHHVEGKDHQRRLLKGSPAASSVVGKKLFRGAEVKTKDEVEPIRDLRHGEFYCRVCKVLLKSEEALDRHVQSDDHIRCDKDEKLLLQNLRMEKKYGIDYLKDMGITVKQAGTWRRYHCEWCQDYFKLVSEARDHCGTHRHKENAMRRRWEKEEFGSLLADYTEDLEWPTAPDISHLPTRHQLRQEKIIRTDGQNVPGVTAGWYYCTTCKVSMETPDKISIHINGRRHKLEKHYGREPALMESSWSGRKRRVSEASTVDTPREVKVQPRMNNKGDWEKKRQRNDYNVSRKGYNTDRRNRWCESRGSDWKRSNESRRSGANSVVDDYKVAQDLADSEAIDRHRRQWNDEVVDAGRDEDSDEELLGAFA